MNKQFKNIEDRNRRVEADKAWETSLTRKVIIAILTYLFAVIWLRFLKEEHIFLKGLVPVVGFVLSTVTMAPVKKHWIKNFHQ